MILRMPSTKETNWLRGMKYSCRMSVSSGSELRKYGTESCMGSLRLTRHASAEPIACARVTGHFAERLAIEIGAVDFGVGVEQHLLQKTARRGRQVAVHQADILVLFDLAGKQRRKFLVVEHAPPGLIDKVVGDIELGLNDHAKQAVAADHEIKQLLVLTG